VWGGGRFVCGEGGKEGVVASTNPPVAETRGGKGDVGVLDDFYGKKKRGGAVGGWGGWGREPADVACLGVMGGWGGFGGDCCLRACGGKKEGIGGFLA